MKSIKRIVCSMVSIILVNMLIIKNIAYADAIDVKPIIEYDSKYYIAVFLAIGIVVVCSMLALYAIFKRSGAKDDNNIDNNKEDYLEKEEGDIEDNGNK